jgi:hypothetical protein
MLNLSVASLRRRSRVYAKGPLANFHFAHRVVGKVNYS